MKTRKKSILKKPSFQNSGFWETLVPKMSGEEFKDNFRVTRTTFAYLVENLRESLATSEAYTGVPIPVEKKIAISLKVLATNCEYREIGIIFGVVKATVCKTFKRFIDSAMKSLSHHISDPTEDRFREIAINFEQLWQYPMAVGAIDGCHFCVRVPMTQSTDYYNYKCFKSVVALVICDATYKVWYVKTGVPGKTNDAGAFKVTKLFKALETGLLPQDTRVFGGTDIPYHLLGDGAFALKKWLIKPFIYAETAPEDQLLFNRRHSRARRVIENVFGRVKGRWRRLAKRLEVNIEDAQKVIRVAFILHNICEEASDSTKAEWLLPIQPLKARRRLENKDTANDTGSEIRNGLKRFFVSQPYQPWGQNK